MIEEGLAFKEFLGNSFNQLISSRTNEDVSDFFFSSHHIILNCGPSLTTY